MAGMMAPMRDRPTLEPTLLAERMASAGPLYPSALHVAAEGLGEPPQGPSAWGSLFARLRARGWRKVYAPRMSRVEARNGATEPFAWERPACG